MNIEIYQETAANWLQDKNRGMVVAPAGSGKTWIAALALSKFQGRHGKVKIGWLCNTTEQKEQAERALELFNCEARVECAAAATDWKDCGILVADECHHLQAAGWLRQIETCKGIWWGFTATPSVGNEERDNQLQEMFERNVFTVKREEVARRVTSAKVVMLGETDDVHEMIDSEIQRQLPRRRNQMQWLSKKTGYMPSEGELWGQVAWQVCVEIGIVGNARRNEKAVQLAREHFGDQVLVLVNQVEHAQCLAGQIPGAVACFAKMGAKARRAALAGFTAGKIKCLVATSLADEGLDLPNASVLILVSGGRSNAKTEQRTGRVLRTFTGKKHGLIYDWQDQQHPLMEKHSRIRQALYRQLGYEITMPGSVCRAVGCEVSPPTW